MNLEEKILKEEVIFKGEYLNIAKMEVLLPDGKIKSRDVIRHPGATAIIAFLDDDNIILIEQFRLALNKVILEIPAGKLNHGEDIKECARRELEEETGYKANRLEYLGSIAPAPGFCDELLHLYKASDLVLGSKNEDEDEFTNVKIININKVKEMIKKGEIIDSKTISILAYL